MKKYNVLVPLAGKGQRMIDGGYYLPKPMLMVGDRHIIDYGLDSIDLSECNLIFVVRRDHVCNYAIDKSLKKKFGDNIQLVIAENDTKGSVDSCYLARKIIENEVPLLIFNPDIYFEPKFKPTDEIFKNDGFILTFKANSKNYSYVQKDQDGLVIKTAEKIVISKDAAVGVYCFKSGKIFCDIAREAMHTGKTSGNNEYYICPLYNILIENGGKVRTDQVPIIYIMGTPSEMIFFKEVIFPYFLPRLFILCSDHSGFKMKEIARQILKKMGIKYIDCGCYSTNDCDYSDYVSQAVETRKYYPGGIIMGFCRSGQGINICANKTTGIRSALVSTPEGASLGLRHNAANFFAIPEGNTNKSDMGKIIEVLMTEKFEGGRHQNRLQKNI